MNRGPSLRASKSRVFLVDDHPIVRHGVSQLINRETDLMICGEAEDGTRAISAIGAVKPDVVIVDLTLKRGSGFSLIKNLTSLYPKLPILVLTIHEESLYAERALRAGAKGYLMKEEAMESVLLAIRRLLSGKVYLSEKMRDKLANVRRSRDGEMAASPQELLSDRELEIFSLIGQGVGTRQIAKELHLSISTVETHRARIKVKLGVDSATNLLRQAVNWVENEGAR